MVKSCLALFETPCRYYISMYIVCVYLCIYVVFLPGKSQGQRSLVGYSSWNHNELVKIEVTEHAHTNTYIHIYGVFLHTCFLASSPEMAQVQ